MSLHIVIVSLHEPDEESCQGILILFNYRFAGLKVVNYSYYSTRTVAAFEKIIGMASKNSIEESRAIGLQDGSSDAKKGSVNEAGVRSNIEGADVDTAIPPGTIDPVYEAKARVLNEAVSNLIYSRHMLITQIMRGDEQHRFKKSVWAGINGNSSSLLDLAGQMITYGLSSLLLSVRLLQSRLLSLKTTYTDRPSHRCRQ